MQASCLSGPRDPLSPSFPCSTLPASTGKTHTRARLCDHPLRSAGPQVLTWALVVPTLTDTCLVPGSQKRAAGHVRHVPRNPRPRERRWNVLAVVYTQVHAKCMGSSSCAANFRTGDPGGSRSRHLIRFDWSPRSRQSEKARS